MAKLGKSNRVKFNNPDAKMIFVIFIGLIITATFMVNIGDAIVQSTQLTTLTNGTFTSAAVNSSLTLPGRANTTSITIVNATNATLVWTSNFTVDTTNSNGVIGVFLVTRDVTGVGFPAESINVSYTYEPAGYLADSGSRNVALLILIMSALAMVVFTIVMLWKGSLAGMLGKFK